MNWQTVKYTFQRWLYRLLIMSKRIKKVRLSPKQLNQMLSGTFPQTHLLKIPASRGELTVNEINLSIPKDSDRFHIELTCSFTVDSLANKIYQAHLLGDITALPKYDTASKSILLTEAEIIHLHLVHDEYSAIQDTRHIIKQLVPNTLQSVIKGTVKTAMTLLGGSRYDDVKNYLSLYMSGSKQLILEHHKQELTEILRNIAENGDLKYTMDESMLKEQLFAELGQSIRVSKGYLQFIFHE